MRGLKSVFFASVCVLALGACETMSDTWDAVTGTAPSADDVPPVSQAAVPPANVPCPCANNAVAQQTVTTTMTTAPNLADVPPRPTAAELPSPTEVQATRQTLAANNAAANGGFMSSLSTPSMPSAQPAASGTAAANTSHTLRDPHAPATATVMAATTQTTTVAQQSDIGGQLLGLQPTAGGQFQLISIPPEATVGTFNLLTSVVQVNGAPLTMPQYQNLQNVASSYKTNPGRVRVVGYGDQAMGLQQATTIAAYLVDLGVEPKSIRLKVDPAIGLNAPTDPNAKKIDVFLEANR